MLLEPRQPLSRKITVAKSIVIVTLRLVYKGADVDICRPRKPGWIPAFAGMTQASLFFALRASDTK